MKIRQANKLQAVVPTASMADIAFLLIIFFMLTTSATMDKADADLPPSLIRTEVQHEAAVVSIDSRQVVRFTDGVADSTEVSSLDDLSNRAQDVLRQFPDKQFIIKVDKRTPYRLFDDVYGRLRNLQVRNISLLTEQKIAK